MSSIRMPNGRWDHCNPQNRDLNGELEALRDQLNRSHDELSRVREGGMGKSDGMKLSEPSISEFGLNDLDFKDADLAKLDSDLNLGNGVPLDSAMDNTRGSEGGGSDTVAKGETLYRISKEYGVSVQDLKSSIDCPITPFKSDKNSSSAVTNPLNSVLHIRPESKEMFFLRLPAFSFSPLPEDCGDRHFR